MASVKVISTTFVVTLLFLLLNDQTNAQDEFQSPCPRLFVYEGKSKQPDKWYGIITLLSESDLSGIWLRLIFDKQSIQLGNWFGEAVTTDNKEYLVKNPNFHLKANVPQTVRFFLKYNPSEPPPKLISFRLNAKTVCPEPIATEIPPAMMELQTNSSLDTTGGGGGGGAAAQPEVTTPKLFVSPKRDRPIVPVKPQAQAAPQIAGNADLPISAVLSSIAVNDESCGVVKVPARPLIIIKGQATLPGQWPWHAALYRNINTNLKYICGGSLITRSHVLTAAHCVSKLPSETLYNADLFAVYLGRYSNESSPIIQVRTVTKITVHPEFNARYLRNDIAVMRLKDPVEYTDFVQPVCIWQGDDNLDNIVDELGTVVGWGLNESGEQSETLMKAHMPVVSTLDCIFSNRQFFSQFASYKTFCAGFRNGSSPCTGDSGGGMVFPRSDSSGQNVVWYVRGVVSLSVSVENNKRVPCDTKNYVLFTDVAKYLSWLEYVIKR